MKAVRVEVGGERGVLLIGIVCDCGKNGLEDEAGNQSFKHEVRVGHHDDTVLHCSACGKKYRLFSQEGHIHIKDEK
jgi:hypothetical protein